jgi:hypothetical protein
MNIEYKYQIMVFKNEYNGNPIYKLGLSKKKSRWYIYKRIYISTI